MSSEKDNLALSLWYSIKTASKRKKKYTESFIYSSKLNYIIYSVQFPIYYNGKALCFVVRNKNKI